MFFSKLQLIKRDGGSGILGGLLRVQLSDEPSHFKKRALGQYVADEAKGLLLDLNVVDHAVVISLRTVPPLSLMGT